MNTKLLIEKYTTKFNKEKLKLLAPLFLLGVLAVIQYILGNKYYALFFVVIIFTLTIYRRPPIFLIVGSILIIIFFATPEKDTWLVLSQAGKLGHDLNEIFLPNSGKEVLPAQVQQMLSLLSSHHIMGFQLSDKVDQDTEIHQRIIESAWPIKMDKTSSYVFCSIEEIKNNHTCVVIDKRKDVALEYCH